MGLRRSGVTKDYEEMPGANVPTGLEAVETNRDHPLSQEFELSSVSVVPDGTFPKKIIILNQLNNHIQM